jgi:hypothetical protein
MLQSQLYGVAQTAPRLNPLVLASREFDVSRSLRILPPPDEERKRRCAVRLTSCQNYMMLPLDSSFTYIVLLKRTGNSGHTCI